MCVCVCVVCAELQHLISFYVVLSCVTAESNNTRNERDLHCDVSGIACPVSDVKFVVISTWHRNFKIPIYRVTQKTVTFENPNKNWRNPRKKKLLTEIEPLQLAF